jgi:hypothetical protein
MSGDYSTSNRVLSWLASTVTTQGEEIILPGSTTNNITVPDSGDWAFAGDFCIELFGLKITDNTLRHGIISQYNASGDQRSWGLDYRGDLSPKRFSSNFSTNGIAVAGTVEGNVDLTNNTPYDVCLERDGTTVRIYVDGAMVGSGTISGALFNSNQLLDIGMGIAQTATPWIGRFKAIRITRVSRYASDSGYVVPTLPLPTQG